MSQSVPTMQTHDLWVVGHRERGMSASTLSADFYEICAEAARRNRLLPSFFYNAVLETGLCSTADLDLNNAIARIQLGAFTLASILESTNTNYLEAAVRFANWVMEYKSKHQAALPLTEINSNSLVQTDLHEPSKYLDALDPLLADYTEVAETAAKTANHPDIKRDFILGVIGHRKALHQQTPPLPLGTYKKESMLVPMNISAMLGRLGQLSMINNNEYEAINRNFENTFGCPIIRIKPLIEAQNVAAMAIDLAVTMYVHSCDIQEALCVFSRLEKSTAKNFSESVKELSLRIAPENTY